MQATCVSRHREATSGGRVAGHHLEERRARLRELLGRWIRCSESSNPRCWSRSSWRDASSTSAVLGNVSPVALPVMELDFSAFPPGRRGGE